MCANAKNESFKRKRFSETVLKAYRYSVAAIHSFQQLSRPKDSLLQPCSTASFLIRKYGKTYLCLEKRHLFGFFYVFIRVKKQPYLISYFSTILLYSFTFLTVSCAFKTTRTIPSSMEKRNRLFKTTCIRLECGIKTESANIYSSIKERPLNKKKLS